MKVLVCGSRDWGDPLAIRRVLNTFPRGTVVHGACSRKARGVEQSADMLADAAARSLGFDVKPYPADWETEPRRAGFIRNVEMLDDNPDIDRVLAFQRNGSRGTQHMVDEARKRGIPVEVHTA